MYEHADTPMAKGRATRTVHGRSGSRGLTKMSAKDAVENVKAVDPVYFVKLESGSLRYGLYACEHEMTTEIQMNVSEGRVKGN